MAGTVRQWMLVDTDVLIDVARRVKGAVDYLHDHEMDYDLAISAVTEMELVVGCRNKKELANLDALLKYFRIIQVHENISKNAAILMRKYRLSHGLLIPDALIAATAIGCDIPLATKNQKDYRYITGLLLKDYPQY